MKMQAPSSGGRSVAAKRRTEQLLDELIQAPPKIVPSPAAIAALARLLRHTQLPPVGPDLVRGRGKS
jgi:hypothetical protein